MNIDKIFDDTVKCIVDKCKKIGVFIYHDNDPNFVPLAADSVLADFSFYENQGDSFSVDHIFTKYFSELEKNDKLIFFPLKLIVNPSCIAKLKDNIFLRIHREPERYTIRIMFCFKIEKGDKNDL
jgi:hypothetical protein